MQNIFASFLVLYKMDGVSLTYVAKSLTVY
jgi:hypothetical protein